MSRLSDFSRAPEFPFRFQFRPIFSLGLAFSLFFATVSLVSAQEQSATAVSHQVKEIFEHAAKAVVKIHGVDEHCEISGTGFFIDPTGTLYTAYTVGGEAGNFTIEFNGKKYPARQLLADIRSGFVRFGEARHGWVGINVSEAPKPVEGSRAEMTQIMEGTPAAGSGIKPGDILLQVGRKKVTEPEDVLDASFFITAGDVVPITVLRGNQKLTFNVRAGFHPASQHGVLIASPASPTINQAIPLKLDSEAQRTP